MGNGYRVASVAEFRSLKPTKAQEELELERIQAMDFANRESSSLKRTSTTQRRSVRFTASTKSNLNNSPAGINGLPTRTDREKNVGHSTPQPTDQLQQAELLMPVRYSPPSESESGSEHSTLSDDSWNSVSHNVEQLEAQYALPASDVDRTSKSTDLTVDTNTYQGHTRNTSSMSRHGRRDSHQFEIYFTPTDYTRSQIFLSSPVRNPELPREQPEDECMTPKASMSRPPSAIFFGSDAAPPSPEIVKNENLNITPA